MVLVMTTPSLPGPSPPGPRSSVRAKEEAHVPTVQCPGGHKPGRKGAPARSGPVPDGPAAGASKNRRSSPLSGSRDAGMRASDSRMRDGKSIPSDICIRNSGDFNDETLAVQYRFRCLPCPLKLLCAGLGQILPRTNRNASGLSCWCMSITAYPSADEICILLANLFRSYRPDSITNSEESSGDQTHVLRYRCLSMDARGPSGCGARTRQIARRFASASNREKAKLKKRPAVAAMSIIREPSSSVASARLIPNRASFSWGRRPRR